jgi:hypothetical protein
MASLTRGDESHISGASCGSARCLACTRTDRHSRAHAPGGGARRGVSKQQARQQHAHAGLSRRNSTSTHTHTSNTHAHIQHNTRTP